MDQQIIERFSNYDQKYFLQVPESNELTSGFGSQSSKISIDRESLDNSCDSLSIPQNSVYSKISEKSSRSPSNFDGDDNNDTHATAPTREVEKALNEKETILDSGNAVPLHSAHKAQQYGDNCLSENHFYNLFQHHYHLMAHIHRCFLQQSQLHDSECWRSFKEQNCMNRRLCSNQCSKQNENYLEENNSFSLISTNSSGFVDFNNFSDGLEEVFTEKLSCDSQFSSISAPFDNRNHQNSKDKPQKLLCPVCNYKYTSKRSIIVDEKPQQQQQLHDENQFDHQDENDYYPVDIRHQSINNPGKTSRIFRDEVHPSRLLSTSLNDSNIYTQDYSRNSSTTNQGYHRWPSITKRTKNKNILMAVVKPRMKTNHYPGDSLAYQNSTSNGNTNQNSSGERINYTNSNDTTHNNDDIITSNNNYNDNNHETQPPPLSNESTNDENPEKTTRSSNDKDNIAVNENTLANQGNNSESTTYTEPGTRTCCFCWCCCCSCSCMQMRPNADKKKGVSNSQNSQNKNEISQADEKPVTYDEVKLWGESFDSLMQSTSGQKVFREFLRSEYSDENIMFWLACEDLKQEVDSEIVEEKARIIYEDYISILSPKEVSLDSRVREIINGNMIEPSPRTFDEAQLQIYTLMHRDSYPRFLNSKLYKELLQKTKCDSYNS